MKIVKFKNGTYDLRRISPFGFEFADLREANFWFSSTSYYCLDHCRGTFEEVEFIYNEHIKKTKILKDKGRAIDSI